MPRNTVYLPDRTQDAILQGAIGNISEGIFNALPRAYMMGKQRDAEAQAAIAADNRRTLMDQFRIDNEAWNRNYRTTTEANRNQRFLLGQEATQNRHNEKMELDRKRFAENIRQFSQNQTRLKAGMALNEIMKLPAELRDKSALIRLSNIIGYDLTSMPGSDDIKLNEIASVIRTSNRIGAENPVMGDAYLVSALNKSQPDMGDMYSTGDNDLFQMVRQVNPRVKTPEQLDLELRRDRAQADTARGVASAFTSKPATEGTLLGRIDSSLNALRDLESMKRTDKSIIFGNNPQDFNAPSEKEAAYRENLVYNILSNSMDLNYSRMGDAFDPLSPEFLQRMQMQTMTPIETIYPMIQSLQQWRTRSAAGRPGQATLQSPPGIQPPVPQQTQPALTVRPDGSVTIDYGAMATDILSTQ